MKTLRKCEGLWLWVAIATLTTTPAWADGELDTTFGNNGGVKIAFPNAPTAYLRDVAVVNGVIEAAGFSAIPACTTGNNLLIVQLSLSGSIIGTPVSQPLAIPCTAPTLTLSIDPATGNVFVISNKDAVVQLFDSSGRRLWTNSAAGLSCVNGINGLFGRNRAGQAGRAAVDSQGQLVGICDSGNTSGLYRLSGQRENSSGPTFPWLQLPIVMTQDPASGAYYFAGTNPLPAGTSCNLSAGNEIEALGRLNHDTGAWDTSYGVGGAAVPFCDDGGYVGGIAVDSSGNVIIVGRENLVANGVEAFPASGFVARLDPTGTRDARFGSDGVVVVSHMPEGIADVRVDRSQRVYALAVGDSLLRLKASGTPDVSFGSSSGVAVLNGPNSQWQSLQFTDGSESSAYLVGGAAMLCVSDCPPTAIIAKVTLASVVSAGSTVTVLNSSPTTISSRESVTLTTTIIGTNPTGTVTFKDASTILATVKLVAGSASYIDSTLAVGRHALSASYSGDAQNAASTSQTVFQRVQALATTTISASAVTVKPGDSVRVTATVGGANPTGTVRFFVNGGCFPYIDYTDVCGSVNSVSGRASVTLGQLDAGQFVITAVYNGDENNTPSMSAALSVTASDVPPPPQPPPTNEGGGGGSVSLLELYAALTLALLRVAGRFRRGGWSWCRVRSQRTITHILQLGFLMDSPPLRRSRAGCAVYFRGIYLYPPTIVRGGRDASTVRLSGVQRMSVPGHSE